MKTKLLFFAFVFLVSGSFVYGQSIQEISSKEVINQIHARFCDYELEPNISKDLSMYVQPGQEKDICIVFENNSEYNLELGATFHPAGRDANNNRVCNSSSKDMFFEDITQPERGDGLIKVPAQSQKIQNIKVRGPIGVEGLKEGCFVRNIQNASNDSFGMFSIKIQKAHNFDVLIQGEREIRNSLEFVKNNGRYITLEENENKDYHMIAKLRNNGNIEQMVNINGNISNRLGFNEKFQINEELIKPGETKELTYNIGKLPGYKGYFTVDVELEHRPFFAFGADQVPEEMKKSEFIKETFGVFIMSTVIWIIIAIILLIILKKIFFRKKK